MRSRYPRGLSSGSPRVPLWGKIVFHSERDGNVRNLYDGLGPNQTRLGFTMDRIVRPFGLPMDDRLRESYREGNREVYVMDADGKKQRNLTRHPALDAFPGWSPDGSQIVFASARNDGRSG